MGVNACFVVRHFFDRREEAYLLSGLAGRCIDRLHHLSIRREARYLWQVSHPQQTGVGSMRVSTSCSRDRFSVQSPVHQSVYVDICTNRF
jgi:hypothetical protein